MSIKAPLESSVVKACLQYLTLVCGFPAWRQNSGAVAGEHNGKRRFVRFNSMPGMSDIVAVLPGGRACFVECKREGGKLSDDQRAFLERMEAAGAFACVVTSVEQLIEILEKEGLTNRPKSG